MGKSLIQICVDKRIVFFTSWLKFEGRKTAFVEFSENVRAIILKSLDVP
jgi:hypothetical protein